MEPILTIIFSTVLSGITAWIIAERRIKSEPELHRNRILIDMKAELIKAIQGLLNDFSFNDRNDPQFLSWQRRVATLNLSIAEQMNDDSVIFMTNATQYTTMFAKGKIDKRDFSKKIVQTLTKANACIKVSTGFMDGPPPEANGIIK